MMVCVYCKPCVVLDAKETDERDQSKDATPEPSQTCFSIIVHKFIMFLMWYYSCETVWWR